MENNIQALVGAFVGIAILLGISVQILGNSVADCSDLPGFDSTGNPAVHTGWALACEDQNLQTQSAFALLVIVLIVVAAVVILTVVKML